MNGSAAQKRKIRICLIWPPGFLLAYAIPLPLALLKSNLDPQIAEVKIIDCVLNVWDAESAELMDAIAEFQPDVVGISSWSPMFPEALRIFERVKNLYPRVLTILGGPHATTYHEAVMNFKVVDFVFRGESEFSFAEFIRRIHGGISSWDGVAGLVYRDDGRLVANEMERREILDEIKAPDFKAIQLDAYNERGYRWNSPKVANAPLWITRGCPYRCQYCSSPVLNGKEVRKHSAAYMVGQILHLYHEHGVRWFNIIDDNFTFDVAYAKEFCRQLIALNLPEVGFGTPNGIRMSRGDPELWDLMKLAGWRQLIVAPESGSQHTLNLMKKDLKLGLVHKKVEEIKQAGLKVQAFFIIGYPGETASDIEETFRLIRKCRFNFVFLANFQPLPGTPIYQELVAKGEISDGLLPQNFSDGLRPYTPPELRTFNFARFFFRTHLMMLWENPANIPYHLQVVFRQYPFSMIAKKLWKTVNALFAGSEISTRNPVKNYWPGAMNFVAQSLFKK